VEVPCSDDDTKSGTDKTDKSLFIYLLSALSVRYLGGRKKLEGRVKAIQIVTVPEQAAFYIGDASKYLGISPNTLRKRADLGLVPCKQDENGKRVFLLEDLDNYLKSLHPYQHNGNPFSNRPVKAGCEKGGTP